MFFLIIPCINHFLPPALISKLFSQEPLQNTSDKDVACVPESCVFASVGVCASLPGHLSLVMQMMDALLAFYESRKERPLVGRFFFHIIARVGLEK